jgi:hypothetical protein
VDRVIFAVRFWCSSLLRFKGLGGFCSEFFVGFIFFKKGGEKGKKLLAGVIETLTFALPNEKAGFRKRVL